MVNGFYLKFGLFLRIIFTVNLFLEKGEIDIKTIYGIMLNTTIK